MANASDEWVTTAVRITDRTIRPGSRHLRVDVYQGAAVAEVLELGQSAAQKTVMATTWENTAPPLFSPDRIIGSGHAHLT